MKHNGCGGEIIYRTDLPPYEYEADNIVISEVHPYVCSKCGREILGDMEIEDDPEE